MRSFPRQERRPADGASPTASRPHLQQCQELPDRNVKFLDAAGTPVRRVDAAAYLRVITGRDLTRGLRTWAGTMRAARDCAT